MFSSQSFIVSCLAAVAMSKCSVSKRRLNSFLNNADQLDDGLAQINIKGLSQVSAFKKTPKDQKKGGEIHDIKIGESISIEPPSKDDVAGKRQNLAQIAPPAH